MSKFKANMPPCRQPKKKTPRIKSKSGNATPTSVEPPSSADPVSESLSSERPPSPEGDCSVSPSRPGVDASDAVPSEKEDKGESEDDASSIASRSFASPEEDIVVPDYISRNYPQDYAVPPDFKEGLPRMEIMLQSSHSWVHQVSF